MVQIKFIKFGANSAFGGFGPGDKLRTNEQMARHLVEEAGVAVYAEAKAAPAPEVAPEVVAPEPAKRTRKAK